LLTLPSRQMKHSALERNAVVLAKTAACGTTDDVLTRSPLQVAELETLFEGLRGDVDSLFMQTPSVDQEGLCRQCEEMHRHSEEQVRA